MRRAVAKKKKAKPRAARKKPVSARKPKPAKNKTAHTKEKAASVLRRAAAKKSAHASTAKARKAPAGKKKHAVARHKARQRPPAPSVKRETFDLSFPKTEARPEPALPYGQKVELPSPAPSAELAEIEKRKRVPHAATAIIGALAVTGIFAAIFLFIMNIGQLYTLAISSAVFVGFAILIFNLLESGG